MNDKEKEIEAIIEFAIEKEQESIDFYNGHKLFFERIWDKEIFTEN